MNINRLEGDMGAATFENFGKGADPKAVFRNLVREAAHDRGHGGYTGTIAEKHAFVVVRQNPVTLQEAQRLAYEMLDNADERVDDKWGPAGAIPVLASGAVKSRSRIVTLSYPQAGHISQSELDELVLAKVALKPGETLQNVEIVEDNILRRTKIATTEGKAQLRYFIVPHGTLQARGEGYSSSAEARKHLDEYLKQQANAPFVGVHDHEYEVIGITRRESGSGLMTGRIEVKSRKLKVKVTIRGVPTSSEAAGWLFFGWASS